MRSKSPPNDFFLLLRDPMAAELRLPITVTPTRRFTTAKRVKLGSSAL
jgi:hypothetical protein